MPPISTQLDQQRHHCASLLHSQCVYSKPIVNTSLAHNQRASDTSESALDCQHNCKLSAGGAQRAKRAQINCMRSSSCRPRHMHASADEWNELIMSSSLFELETRMEDAKAFSSLEERREVGKGAVVGRGRDVQQVAEEVEHIDVAERLDESGLSVSPAVEMCRRMREE